MSHPPWSGSWRTNNSVATTSSFPADCASCSLLKVLLAAAAAAPELILQTEIFLRVIPCSGGGGKGLGVIGRWLGVHFLPWWEKEGRKLLLQ